MNCFRLLKYYIIKQNRMGKNLYISDRGTFHYGSHAHAHEQRIRVKRRERHLQPWEEM